MRFILIPDGLLTEKSGTWVVSQEALAQGARSATIEGARAVGNIVITEQEKLMIAAQMHEIWCDWMKYVFSVGELRTSGEMRLPQWAVARWQRQISTAFDDLTPTEQAADVLEAEKIIYVLAGTV